MLKKLFPFSYRANYVGGLVVAVLGYLIAGALISFLCSWLASLWLVGWIFHIILSVIDLYFFVGIIVSVLVFLGIVK